MCRIKRRWNLWNIDHIAHIILMLNIHLFFISGFYADRYKIPANPLKPIDRAAHPECVSVRHIRPSLNGFVSIDWQYSEWRFRSGHSLSPSVLLKRSDETFETVTWIESYQVKWCNRIIL